MEYRLPDLGEGIDEAEVVRWLVKPGDRVVRDQPVAQVQTDKALVDLPSPVAGVVDALGAREGERLQVGGLVVDIREEGAGEGRTGAVQGGAAARGAMPGGAAARGAMPGGAAARGAVQGGVVQGIVGTIPGEEPLAALGAGAPARHNGTPAAPALGPAATPATRRLARELGLELASVLGTGPGGRITDADLRAAAALREQPAPAPAERAAPAAREAEPVPAPAAQPARPTAPLAAQPARPTATPAPIPPAPIPPAPATPAPATPAPVPPAPATPAPVPPAPATTPVRGLRRRIAERMEEAARIPRVTMMDEADATALVDLRAQLRPAAEAAGVRLGYLPIVCKLAMAGLASHPALNAHYDAAAGQIRTFAGVDLGLATATADGLLVPVIRGADRLGLLELAKALDQRAEGARTRHLGLQDLRGSTFTVTSPGPAGGLFATPLLNPPEVAILAVGRIAERAVARGGQVVAAPTLPFSLTFDHRAIDGADAAGFAATFTALLGSPARLLL